jgi:chlorite dismutase
MTEPAAVAHPPETVEGWYALHQIFRLDRAMLREWAGETVTSLREGAASALREVAAPAGGGWSAVVPLIGSTADVMLVHFRPTLDAIGDVQRRLATEPLFDFLDPVYSFLSVTEAGLYHITAELAREAVARGGSVGDAEYRRQMDERAAIERDSPHVRRRLFPEPRASVLPVTSHSPSLRTGTRALASTTQQTRPASRSSWRAAVCR